MALKFLRQFDLIIEKIYPAIESLLKQTCLGFKQH